MFICTNTELVYNQQARLSLIVIQMTLGRRRMGPSAETEVAIQGSTNTHSEIPQRFAALTSPSPKPIPGASRAPTITVPKDVARKPFGEESSI